MSIITRQISVITGVMIIWTGVFAYLPLSHADNDEFSRSAVTIFKNSAGDFISRLEKYYLQNSRYAGQEGKSRFSDIGLKPEDWENNPQTGVLYSPKGDRLEVYPAAGYTFFIDEPNGNTRILSWDIKWPLIYSLKDKKWYFSQIEDDENVNIDTLYIKKDSPYNPKEYQSFKK